MEPIPEQEISRLLVTKMYIGFILIFVCLSQNWQDISQKTKKLFSIDFGGCAIWTRVLIDIFISFIGHIRSLGVINFMFYWNRYIDLYLNLTGKSHLMDFQNSFNSCVGFLTILSKRVFLPFPSPKLGPPDWASRLGLQSRPKFFKSQRNC